MYVYAHAKGKLDEVNKDVQMLAQAFRQSTEFEQLLMDKTVSAEDKREFVVDFLKRAGTWRGTQKFFAEVASQDDIHRIDKIAMYYGELYGQYKTTVPVHITTAQPVDKAALDKLVSRIRASTLRPQDEVVVTSTVDPLLLDGYTYSVRGSVVDLSLRSQIESAFKDVAQRREQSDAAPVVPKFDLMKASVF